MDYYEEALKRDPSDIRTNIAVGNIHLKNGDYDNARSYFAKAIKRLTKDYTRPSNCEALYLQGLTLKAWDFMMKQLIHFTGQHGIMPGIQLHI